MLVLPWLSGLGREVLRAELLARLPEPSRLGTRRIRFALLRVEVRGDRRHRETRSLALEVHGAGHRVGAQVAHVVGVLRLRPKPVDHLARERKVRRIVVHLARQALRSGQVSHHAVARGHHGGLVRLGSADVPAIFLDRGAGERQHGIERHVVARPPGAHVGVGAQPIVEPLAIVQDVHRLGRCRYRGGRHADEVLQAGASAPLPCPLGVLERIQQRPVAVGLAVVAVHSAAPQLLWELHTVGVPDGLHLVHAMRQRRDLRLQLPAAGHLDPAAVDLHQRVGQRRVPEALDRAVRGPVDRDRDAGAACPDRLGGRCCAVLEPLGLLRQTLHAGLEGVHLVVQHREVRPAWT